VREGIFTDVELKKEKFFLKERLKKIWFRNFQKGDLNEPDLKFEKE